MLGKAIAIASDAFVNKTDKGDKPYILHCLYVMHKVKHLGETAMICAVLHDLIEDTDWTIEDLEDEGFSREILSILILLTHIKEDTYMEYIVKLSNHPIARQIKMADIEHNTKVTRLKGLRKKDFNRLQKYHVAYEFLKD